MEFRKVALRGNDGEEGKNGVPTPRYKFLGAKQRTQKFGVNLILCSVKIT